MRKSLKSALLAAALSGMLGVSGAQAESLLQDGAADAPRHYALDAAIEVYFGGMDIMHFEWQTTRDGPAYKAASRVYPVGVASLLFDIDVSSRAEGVVDGPNVYPAYYENNVVESDDTARSTRIEFGPKGATAVSNVGVELLVSEQEMLALVQGMIDPLSAALFNETFTRGGDICSGTTRIFTGDSAFDLSFSPVEETSLNASRYNIYEGAAMECEVNISPGQAFEAGTKERMEKTRNDDRKPARLFVGRLKAPDGGPDILVPAKVLVPTSMGTVVAHLVKADLVDPRAQSVAAK